MQTTIEGGSGTSLTPLFEDTTERRARDTSAGMAHWTRTGPDGKRCVDCRFFNCKPEDRKAFANPIADCAKFKALTKSKGPKFGGRIDACRYFEAVT